MKKFLPLILLILGIAILGIVFIVVRGGKSKDIENLPEEEVALLDLSIQERPIVSLTPTFDGHYLYMKVEKIGFDPFSLDYELLYQVPGGVPQGVPGSVNLEGKSRFEAEFLLGSESSGNFRYDEGVEEGNLTLSFRNEDGQLLTRFSTEFHLQSKTDTLTSLDGLFSYELEEESEEIFVIMNTVGLPGDFSSTVDKGPFGIFSSLHDEVPGVLSQNTSQVYYWNGDEWEKLVDNESPDIGIFLIE